MNSRHFFELLKNLILDSIQCLRLSYTEYNELSTKIEELLTNTKRENVKKDPLAKMVLGCVLGGILLIPRFNMISAIFMTFIIFLGYIQLFKSPVHGCTYAALMFITGIFGFLIKSFGYLSGDVITFVVVLPVVVYLIMSLVFYIFRCLDETPQKVLKRDFYEVIKWILFGILIKIA